MAYCNLYFHFVFRTKLNISAIDADAASSLYKFIYGVSERLGCHIHKINGMSDHVHIAVELSSEISASEYMREIKGRSSKWITENHLFSGFQGWGKSYFVSTFSRMDMEKVKSYIGNQQEHHKKLSFREELESIFALAGFSDKLHYFIED